MGLLSFTDAARRAVRKLGTLMPSGEAPASSTRALALCGSTAAIMLISGPIPHNDKLADRDEANLTFQGSLGVSRAVSANSDEAFLPVLANAVLQDPVLLNAKPFHYSGSNTNRLRAADCLAAAAWYEAGSDPVGQKAVIQTVINRVNHPGFPNSVCGVVFQGSQLATGCQFTFTCDGSLIRRRPSNASWERALARSKDALNGFVDESVGTATHYHADYVNPWWSSKLVRLSTVGPHIFYRWAGGRGSFGNRTRLDTEADYRKLVQKTMDGSMQDGKQNGDVEAQGLVNIDPNEIQPGQGIPVTPTTNAIFLQLSDPQTSGRWAVSAMKACSGRSDCQVIGYESAGSVGRNKSRAADARERPLFLFVRDAASSMNIALWDCERIQRPKQSQCLPTEHNTLRNLMRERPQA